MKKIITLAIAAFVSVMSLTSCEKESEPANEIKVSRYSVALSGSGEPEMVSVSSTNDEWEISKSDEWLKVEKHTNHVMISADVNTGEGSRSGSVDIFYGKVKETITVVQESNKTVDLSSDGTANCYIAGTNGDYRFAASVRGNGSSADGNSKYIENYGIGLDEAVYATLMWEASYSGDKTHSIGIIDGMPVFSNGNVYVKTGAYEGNAVIAVRDRTGKILWSWHIWVLDDEIETVNGNSYDWMDRNLGALNNTPDDIKNRGLMYQWGRKDPFLPTYEDYATALGNATQADNTQTGNSMDSWDYSGTFAISRNTAPGNVPYSVYYPMTFLKSESDWYLDQDEWDIYNSFLWGNAAEAFAKTIYDPCPAGYMVPPVDAWATSSDISGSWINKEYGAEWNVNNEYYPYSGARSMNSGELTLCGDTGLYWTATMNNKNKGGVGLYLTDDNTFQLSYLPRAYGGSVRCVKEN